MGITSAFMIERSAIRKVYRKISAERLKLRQFARQEACSASLESAGVGR